jgi:hypothetical protein
MAALNQAIDEMQVAYFAQIERMLSDALAVGSHGFLRDPLFALEFDRIRSRLGIVEHYLSCTPDGILMLDAAGTGHLLIVQTDEMAQSQYEIAYDQAAPEELLEMLRSGRHLPYFWKTEGNYTPACENWRPYMHDATEFEGSEWYRYAIVKNPAVFNLKHVIPYGQYLDRLDEEGRAVEVRAGTGGTPR